MKAFLSGALLVVCAASMTSFSVATKRSAPLRVDELTMDRAVRITLPLAQVATPVPFPGTIGLAITSVSSAGTTTSGPSALLSFPFIVRVSVNGAAAEPVVLGQNTSYGGSFSVRNAATFNPPIIVRPGDVLALSADVTGGGFSTLPMIEVTLGGYFVFPGEV